MIEKNINAYAATHLKTGDAVYYKFAYEITCMEVIKLDIPDADFFKFKYTKTSMDLYHKILEETDWRQEQINIHGKKIDIPRLTAWYGKTYKYSGITNEERDMPEYIKQIMEDLREITLLEHNSVLINRYRNGSDSVGYHSDDEKELGKNPFITSLSFGQTRMFYLKNKRTDAVYPVELEHGDCIVMGDKSQILYLHSIPKNSLYNGERLNLTFRTIV